MSAAKDSLGADRLDFSFNVVVPESVLMQELEGEAVLLHLDSGRYYGLDEIGTRMWQLLRTSDSIQMAFDSLMEEYEVDEEQLRRDLVGLISELTEEKLVEVKAAEN